MVDIQIAGDERLPGLDRGGDLALLHQALQEHAIQLVKILVEYLMEMRAGESNGINWVAVRPFYYLFFLLVVLTCFFYLFFLPVPLVHMNQMCLKASTGTRCAFFLPSFLTRRNQMCAKQNRALFS